MSTSYASSLPGPPPLYRALRTTYSSPALHHSSAVHCSPSLPRFPLVGDPSFLPFTAHSEDREVELEGEPTSMSHGISNNNATLGVGLSASWNLGVDPEVLELVQVLQRLGPEGRMDMVNRCPFGQLHLLMLMKVKNLYKGTAKVFARKERSPKSRHFKPDSMNKPAAHIETWKAQREAMKASAQKRKESRQGNRGSGSAGDFPISSRELKNLQSNLGRYWQL
jgi:hypothetical protein